MSYMLLNSSTYKDKPLYFARMTAIGPMSTADPAEAMVFASKEAAMQHPAMFFPLTFFKPVAAPGAAE